MSACLPLFFQVSEVVLDVEALLFLSFLLTLEFFLLLQRGSLEM